MRGFMKAIGLAALGLAYAASPAAAQQPAYPTYYFPAAGYYSTAQGTVFVGAPGYYYVIAPAYQPAYQPSWDAPSYYTPPARREVARGGGPNNPPYYSSAIHSLHGRGIDSSRHGR